MDEPRGNRVEAGVKRVLAAVVGLVLGLAVGLLVALVVVGFGDAFVVTVVLAAIATAVLGFLAPGPFLFLAGLLLSVFGVEGP